MSTYSLPRPAFDVLVEVLGKAKADLFARALEDSITDVQLEARRTTDAMRSEVKMQIKDDLRNELVTRGILDEKFLVLDEKFLVVEARFKLIDEKFKRLDFKLNIFIAIALISLTFANPTFVDLIKHIFK